MSGSAVSSPKFQNAQLSAFSKLYWVFLMGLVASWESKLCTPHSENNQNRLTFLISTISAPCSLYWAASSCSMIYESFIRPGNIVIKDLCDASRIQRLFVSCFPTWQDPFHCLPHTKQMLYRWTMCLQTQDHRLDFYMCVCSYMWSVEAYVWCLPP